MIVITPTSMDYDPDPKCSKLKPLLENIELYFQESSYTLYEDRNIIRVVNYENESYVVKRFKVPNILSRFIYSYFRSSKAKRSYLHSQKLGKKLSVEPIAYIEQYEKSLIKSSYYISKYYRYDYTIGEVLRNKALKNREKILKDFADFTYQLHQLDILHLDYSHGNILIKDPPQKTTGYDFRIIDVNRLQFKRLNLKERLNNFSRVNCDNEDMETVITQYAKHMNMPMKQLLMDALGYRDNFKRKGVLKSKLKGVLKGTN